MYVAVSNNLMNIFMNACVKYMLQIIIVLLYSIIFTTLIKTDNLKWMQVIAAELFSHKSKNLGCIFTKNKSYLRNLT